MQLVTLAAGKLYREQVHRKTDQTDSTEIIT